MERVKACATGYDFWNALAEQFGEQEALDVAGRYLKVPTDYDNEEEHQFRRELRLAMGGNQMSRYKYIAYTDVWGNEEDGWEVNDQFVTDVVVAFPDDAGKDEILSALIEAGCLKAEALSAATLDEGIDTIEIEESESGYPVGRLVRVEEGAA